MNNKTQNILLGVLAVGLIGITVAYAALTQQLKINGTATVKSATWDVHFGTVSNGVATGYATLPETDKLQTVTNNSTTIEGNIGTLKAPGDTITYTFDIINNGDINAVVTGVTPETLKLTCEPVATSGDAAAAKTFCDQLTYSIQYTDGGKIQANDKLGKKGSATATRNVTLTVGYTNTSEAQTLAKEDIRVTASPMTITYGQDVDTK